VLTRIIATVVCLCVFLSVCLSVTRRYCFETAAHIKLVLGLQALLGLSCSVFLRNHGISLNKKHSKNVGLIHYCESPLHCQSPGVASRTPAIAIAQAACDVHNDDDDDDDNNNA